MPRPCRNHCAGGTDPPGPPSAPPSASANAVPRKGAGWGVRPASPRGAQKVTRAGVCAAPGMPGVLLGQDAGGPVRRSELGPSLLLSALGALATRGSTEPRSSLTSLIPNSPSKPLGLCSPRLFLCSGPPARPRPHPRFPCTPLHTPEGF